MRYAILLGISVVGYGEENDVIQIATKISDAHPRRVVRIIDTHTEEIRWTYRGSEAQFNG